MFDLLERVQGGPREQLGNRLDLRVSLEHQKVRLGDHQVNIDNV